MLKGHFLSITFCNVETRINEKQEYEDPNLTFFFSFKKDINLANLTRVIFFPAWLGFYRLQHWRNHYYSQYFDILLSLDTLF